MAAILSRPQCDKTTCTISVWRSDRQCKNFFFSKINSTCKGLTTFSSTSASSIYLFPLAPPHNGIRASSYWSFEACLWFHRIATLSVSIDGHWWVIQLCLPPTPDIEFRKPLDSFTVSLHSPDGRRCLPSELLKGLSVVFVELWKFPLVTRVHNTLQHKSTPTYNWTNQSEKGDANPSEAMSHTPLNATMSGLCNSVWQPRWAPVGSPVTQPGSHVNRYSHAEPGIPHLATWVMYNGEWREWTQESGPMNKRNWTSSNILTC